MIRHVLGTNWSVPYEKMVAAVVVAIPPHTLEGMDHAVVKVLIIPAIIHWGLYNSIHVLVQLLIPIMVGVGIIVS